MRELKLINYKISNLYYFINTFVYHFYDFVLKDKKNILLCPLNWGIGHATRCVPIINKLIESNFNVIIGADKRPLEFLKKEFPELQYIAFPGYNLNYPEKGNMAIKMFLSAPKILFSFIREHKILKKIIKKYKIDVVISDNRYGLWNKKIPCIFMTHQILVKTPDKINFFKKFLFKINKFYINKFDELWIPDFEGEINLSGDLSHKHKISKATYFIGPLSRFNEYKSKVDISEKPCYDVLVMLSGPEPQRTVLEENILKQLKETKLKSIVVRGITEKSEHYNFSENIKVFSHLESDELINYILGSKIIICRPGYSSIMDLTALGKKAIFIPTPGQTEQEYLAQRFLNKKMFYSVKQKDFNLLNAIEKSEEYSGFLLKFDSTQIDKRIAQLINEI